MKQSRKDNANSADGKRILFVGGNGHHYLSPLLRRGATGALVLDATDERASRRFARERNLDEVGEDFPAAVEMFRPDVVSVGTVYARNGDYVVQALRLGVPVVTDKPLAATPQRLTEIEQLATGPNAPAVVTEFDWRARKELQAARQVIAEGRIGPLVLAIAQKSYKFGRRPEWYADRSLYGGTMLWIASHGLDIVSYLAAAAPGAEGEVSVVCARHGNVSRSEYGTMEDHTATLLSLPGGGTGVVHADLLNPAGAPKHGKDRLRVVGGQGEVLVDEGRCILTTNDDPPQDITPEEAQDPPLADQLLHAALGGESDTYGTVASLATARLILAARDAADAGR